MNRKLKKLEISDIAILVAIRVLVLIVSYMLAAQLYDKSHLIPYGVLVVLFFLLLESGVVCCYSFLDKLSSVFTKKQQKDPSVTISDVKQDEQERESGIYRQSETDSIAEAEEFKLKRQNVIHDYIFWAMAPILEEEEMAALWLEYKEWLERPLYKPKGRNWKWKADKDVRNLDARHLTWNIARRMGLGVDKHCAYTTELCGKFINNLFPDLCKNTDWFTLSKSLTADPEKGYIKIDKPDSKTSIAFHYPVPSEKEEE